ncbi:MAG: pentapeptide repeat-containing protein [Kiloniellales bacterium]|nr:pentapeptide repeat-containing protein [Kiloniellales bacterium]
MNEQGRSSKDDRTRLVFLSFVVRCITGALDTIADALERLHVIRIFGALALVVTAPAFIIDLLDRTEARTVSAWQLVITAAPGNAGKREALQYLNSEPWYWPPKRRVSLFGVDLSPEQQGGQVSLFMVQLPNANLARADLREVNLKYANLMGAGFFEANLSGALFAGADLTDVSLRDANLSNTEFTDEFVPARGLTRAQLDEAWAWSDMRPTGLGFLTTDGGDPAHPMPRLCDPPDPTPAREGWRNVKPEDC